jgi:hypothetical protein
MKNKLFEKIKVFFKGLCPEIGEKVKPVVIAEVVPEPKFNNNPPKGGSGVINNGSVKKRKVVKKTKTEINVNLKRKGKK